MNSGGNGNLIGAANFTNTPTGVDYDIPLRDSGLTRNSAGGYPVRLDDDYKTTLSITNVGDQPGRFTMQINYVGGPYAMYPQELAPGQTATFDVRKIRNQQIPDSSGRLLPANLTVGQIKWSIVGGPQSRLIGRSEIISNIGKVSSSYSCQVSCGNSYHSGRVDLLTAYAAAGDTYQFHAMEIDWDGYDSPQSEYAVNADWITDDSGIATIYNGLATAVAPGDSVVSADWMAPHWTEEAFEVCDLGEVPVSKDGDLIVVDVQKIQYKVSTTWTDVPAGGLGPICNGTAIDFRAVPTSGSFPSGKPTWGGDASGTGALDSFGPPTLGGHPSTTFGGSILPGNFGTGGTGSSFFTGLGQFLTGWLGSLLNGGGHSYAGTFGTPTYFWQMNTGHITPSAPPPLPGAGTIASVSAPAGAQDDNKLACLTSLFSPRFDVKFNENAEENYIAKIFDKLSLGVGSAGAVTVGSNVYVRGAIDLDNFAVGGGNGWYMLAEEAFHTSQWKKMGERRFLSTYFSSWYNNGESLVSKHPSERKLKAILPMLEAPVLDTTALKVYLWGVFGKESGKLFADLQGIFYKAYLNIPQEREAKKFADGFVADLQSSIKNIYDGKIPCK